MAKMHRCGRGDFKGSRVSLCREGALAFCPVSEGRVRMEAAAHAGWEDAVLVVEMLVEVAERPAGGHWKGSALRARGEKTLGRERPCPRWRMGDCGHFQVQGLQPEGGGLPRPGSGSVGKHAMLCQTISKKSGG